MKKVIILFACFIIALPAFAKNENKTKKQKNLPPGLEKKIERTGELPPGWQKKLKKGEILDSDLYKIAENISDSPKSSYPKSKPGTELLKIEDRIIRIKNDTKEIVEIIAIETDL